MWGSGLSNFGQAYRIGDAQNPFFKMQGMLPQAGLQPGGTVPLTGPAILGRPMLPPGVTEAQAALPAGIPGLGAPLLPVKAAAPKPVSTKTVRDLINREQGRGIDARNDNKSRAGKGDFGKF